MPFCKNDDKKTYKGDEPSPKGLGYCAHAEKIGVVKTGLDGKEWIISSTKTGTKRWIKCGEKEKENENKPNCSKFVSYRKRDTSRKYGISYKYIRGLELEKGYIHKFISYNNFAETATKIRAGYKKHQIEKKFKEKYFCGNMRTLKKDNPEFKKIIHPGYKKYYIHDNYSRPFLVYVKNNDVYIYKVPKDVLKKEVAAWIYIELVAKYNAQEVFIGKSPKNPMTEFSGGHGKYFDGNSILLKMGTGKYIYIGEQIYSFTTNKEIVKFVAPVGNNDVPYSYAIDSDKNYYLLIDDLKIIKYDEKITDPYDYFYAFDKKDKKNFPNIKNIKVFHQRIF